MRKWVEQEYLNKKLKDKQINDSFQVSARNLPVVAPDVPLQDNNCDCGVFVLEFTERFLKERAEAFEAISAPENIKKRFKSEFGKDWFPTSEIRRKRQQLIELIEQQRCFD